MEMRDGWNSIPSLKFEAFTNQSSSVRDRFVTNAVVRVTKNDGVAGSEGYTGTKVLDFFVLEVLGDNKAIDGLSKPVVWNFSCAGFAEYIRLITCQVTRVLTGQPSIVGGGPSWSVDSKGTIRGHIKDVLNYYLNDATDGYNNRSTNATVTLGQISQCADPSVDNGRIAVRGKNDTLWDHLCDLARLGDINTSFPMQVWIDTLEEGTGNARGFQPRINLIASDHGTFAFPGHNGYRLTDPFADTTRTILELTETIDVIVKDERERINNRVICRYGGGGTGVAAADTSTASNTNSINKFGLREKKILEPWIQPNASVGNEAATANLARDTQMVTFNGIFSGGASGIKTADVIMKWGELYRTKSGSDFNANIGDLVGVLSKDGTTELVEGKLLAWHYTQSEERLHYFIGLPGIELQTMVGDTRRKVMQRIANSESITATTTNPGESAVFTSASDSNMPSGDNVSLLHTFSRSLKLSGSNADQGVALYVITRATVGSTGDLDLWFGPSDPSDSSSENIISQRVTVRGGDANDRYVFYIPCSLLSGIGATGTSKSSIRMRLTNSSGVTMTSVFIQIASVIVPQVNVVTQA